MNKFLLLLLLFITISSNAQHFFKQVEEKSVIKLRDSERGIVPEKYSTFSIDMKSMVDYLKNAPLQFNKKGESLLMYLPMPDGNMMPFDVVNSPVMESELAAKYPYLLSFKGVSRTDKDINIRFNPGPRGFWASIYWRGNNIYIDPFSEENIDHCISYFTRDYKVDISQYNLSCGVDDKIILDDNYESDRKHDNE